MFATTCGGTKEKICRLSMVSCSTAFTRSASIRQSLCILQWVSFQVWFRKSKSNSSLNQVTWLVLMPARANVVQTKWRHTKQSNAEIHTSSYMPMHAFFINRRQQAEKGHHALIKHVRWRQPTSDRQFRHKAHKQGRIVSRTVTPRVRNLTKVKS